ncbi:MAG: hypothetical protein ACREE7_05320 [Dongiaceae bacterium]
MSSQDTTLNITDSREPPKSLAWRGKKNSRPMTKTQEVVFFGVSFAVAVGLQLTVILKIAAVIDW